MFRFSQPASVSASLVHRNETPCLLVTFNASTPPLIWQLDLEKLSNHTIMLRETNGEWDLGLLMPQGTFSPVAHFDERGEAETAFEEVRRVMVRGEPKPIFYGFRWGLGLTAAIFAGLIVTGLLHIGNPSDTAQSAALQPKTAQESPVISRRVPPALEELNQALSPTGPKEIETGVPVSADDVLPKD